MSLKHRNERGITPRYATLPLLSLILKLIAYLTIGFSLAIFVVGLFTYVFQDQKAVGFVPAIALLFGGLVRYGIGALLLLTISELIHVLLDIEENTRRTADATTGRTAGTTPRSLPGDEDAL